MKGASENGDARICAKRTLGGNIEVGLAWVIKSAVAGVVAGIIMAMFAMIVAGIAGDGFWAPPRAITAVILGTEHAGTDFAFGPAAGGMMLHMMLSAAFGVMFALVVGVTRRELKLGSQLVIGMALGIILSAVNTYAIAELLNGRELFTTAMPAWTWFVAHLMFGAALALLYDVWRHDRTALRA